MKDYYSILGVSMSATADTIKRAYRKLALQYHPDKNSNPAVEQYFKEINEAYDVVGDPQKRFEYDQRLANPLMTANAYAPSETTHRDPAYRYKTATNFVRKPNAQFELMKNSLSFMNKLAWSGCIVLILIAFDIFLPPILQETTIKKFRSTYFRTYSQDHIVIESGESFRINTEARSLLNQGDAIILVRSPLFKKLKRLQNKPITVTVTNLATLYGNFKFVPLLLLITSILGVVIKKVKWNFCLMLD